MNTGEEFRGGKTPITSIVSKNHPDIGSDLPCKCEDHATTRCHNTQNRQNQTDQG